MALVSQKVVLKRDLGEAAAYLDKSNGAASSLHQVLKSMNVDSNVDVYARQTTIATGILASYPVSLLDKTRNTQLKELQIVVGGSGTTTNTVVQARVNGTVKATATVLAAATGAGLIQKVVLNPPVDLADGDVVDLNVPTAPTGGTALTACARIRSVAVELV